MTFNPISQKLSSLKPYYKVVVVGSGYGAGVAAFRLARLGQSVCLLERGKEMLPGQYPKKLMDLKDEVQVSSPRYQEGTRTGLFDFRMNDDVNALVGCGLGGTSLINANVALEADAEVFDSRWPKALRSQDDAENNKKKVLTPYYQTARAALGTNKDAPSPIDVNGSHTSNKDKALVQSGAAMGEIAQKPPINVSRGQNKVPDFGIQQPECEAVGDCTSGCNVGAKNTTLMNYLPEAHKWGAEVFTLANVSHLERSGTRWKVYIEELSTNGDTDTDADENNIKLKTVEADIVILGAGTLGSTEILLRSESNDENLVFSDQLGERFSTNGDAIGFGYNNYWHDSPIINIEDPIERLDDNPDEPTPIYGVGVGLNEDLIEKYQYPGPCITGMIEVRDEDDFRNNMTLEAGVIPGVLASTLPPAFFFQNTQFGDIFQYGFNEAASRLKDADRLGNAIQSSPDSLASLSYTGPVARTQTYLVMGHDSSEGKLKIDSKTNRLRIDWPGIGKSDHAIKANDLMKTANEAIHGQYIPNPMWDETYGYKVITVHPMGGCGMADDPTHGVVNDKCQVFNGSGTDVHEGLYVCDGAVIPASLGVNPLLTITAIAERACELLANDYGWSPIEELTNPDAIASTESENSDQSVNAEADEETLFEKFESDAEKLLEIGLISSVEEKSDLWQKLLELWDMLKKGVFDEAHDLFKDLVEWCPDYFSPRFQFTEQMHGFATDKIDANPGRRTKDFAVAYQRGKADSSSDATSNTSFNLTMQTDDLHKLITDPEHKAEISGTVQSELFQNQSMDASGTFQLMTVDAEQVETWHMIYDMTLTSDDSASKYAFVGFKTIHQKTDSGWWDDVTTLYATVYKDDKNGPVIGQGILNLDLEDFLHQASTFEVNFDRHELVHCLTKDFSSIKDTLTIMAYVKLATFFAMPIFRSYGGLLADLNDFPAKDDQEREVRVIGPPDPEEFPIDLGNGTSIKLIRYEGGSKGPVILAPGFVTAASSFAIDTVDENLVEYLTKNEYDVWLFAYRASPDSGTTNFDYTIDDIVETDWPVAIDKVRSITGADDVQVIAHCTGSMTLLMALLNDLQGVRSVISSQLTLHPVTNWLNYLKADIELVKILEQFSETITRIHLRRPSQGNSSDANTSTSSDLTTSAADPVSQMNNLSPDDIEALIDTICWNVPVPAGEECKNPVCHRIFSVFGPIYLHGQLNHATHIAIREMFDVAPTKPCEQLSDIFEKGYVVNSQGKDTYLQHVERLKLPISFIVGSRNHMILPETSARTFDWLCNQNGEEYYQRKVFPEYGHMDCFIGKTANVDIFPTILELLEAES